ncbi:MAG: hypothetical protein LBL72_05725 [Candidatus Accumulibacter sp.]|jgi:hypothetical protein|nr:hypothetical protein [Accumulibacter sp.]
MLGAETYARVFEQHADGASVLDDLTAKFGRSAYVKGGLEGDRETCFRAGQRSVLEWILGRINQANGVIENDEE